MEKLKINYFVIIIIFSYLLCQNTFATNKADNSLFQKIFTDWSEAFNHKNIEKSCQLFSKKVIADYQGVSQKNYSTICDGFKKIFANSKLTYRYDFKIHQIYRQANLAAVRITWYLSVFDHDKLIEKVQDEGLDIFMKDHDDSWKIVNYIGFPVK